MKRVSTSAREAGSWKPGLVLSILVALGLGYAIYEMGRDPTPEGGRVLHVYCAAGMRLPLEEVVSEFEKEVGAKVVLEHGSSGELEGKLALEKESQNPRADVYIPADVSFVERARTKGLVAESFPLARFQVAVAVKKGNPRGIKKLQDLFEEGVGFVICNQQAGVGKRTKSVLEPLGLYDEVCEHTRATKPRVTEAAMDIKTSSNIDAGLIWDTEAWKNGLDVVRVPELESATSTVTAAVTSTTSHPTLALQFCRFLAAPERGQPAFKRHHFQPIPGDPWAVTPELVLYSGGVNRVAVQETVKAFEEREGCRISVKFAGCGMLVQDIKASPADSKPDLFLTCDASYLPMVGEYFGEAEDVSRTAMGFVTRKDSEKKIETLQDLVPENVTVGISDPEKTALGALTLQLLEAAGVREVVTTKMITAPSAHELRLMMEAHSGKLDVIIIYEANAQVLGPGLQFQVIDHPLANATQNMAAGKNSPYPLLAERLKAALRSAESRERFLGNGFSWIADLEKP